jgi:uncharacterized membrane protein
MTKGRLEAFSDGVIAVIITIMVLELKAPAGSDWTDLKPVWSQFVFYLLSFIFVGIYWNNHHHTMQAVQKVNGRILWANLHLLFWLSLVPWATAWMGTHYRESVPIAVYGTVMLGAAVAYAILIRALIEHHGQESLLAQAIGDNRKGRRSLMLYLLAIPMAFVHPLISYGCFIAVAVSWFVPDARIEKRLDS